MAKATVKSETIISEVTLTLTHDEAEALASICGRGIAGGPLSSVYDVLYDAGMRPDSYDINTYEGKQFSTFSMRKRY